MNALGWLGVILLALWAVLWLGLKVVSGFIHLLVLAGIVLIVWGFLKRGASAISGRG